MRIERSGSTLKLIAFDGNQLYCVITKAPDFKPCTVLLQPELENHFCTANMNALSVNAQLQVYNMLSDMRKLYKDHETSNLQQISERH